jgi:nicotinate-nucleotide adenylyltransferase
MRLSDCHSVLIYGGSFDPPHNAHVELPAIVMRAIGADAIAYVPVANQPLKADRELAGAAHRVAMLRLALRDNPQATVLTDEIDRGGTSYTIDTLRALRKRLPASTAMRLLIGADQVDLFDQWKAADDIIALAEPVVMARPAQSHERPANWAHRYVDVPAMDISSTGIRRRVRAGEPIDHLVPAAVAQYIAEHGLYRN